MKIACASTNGINVDEHFGTASAFYIFDLADGVLTPLDKVLVEPYSDGDQKDHPFTPTAFERVSTALAGCERVYVRKIGDKPAAELRKIGIEPIIHEGAIDAIG
ncbi:MAG: dinitrogenase iron-molybdenum cofactor biosynthesis protein [Desulfobulbaceae bacterium]|nr:MAG: dinitrogenase iron-molybdenum cofactor biosynthesis protein [Desulfobulbaceae bacterium]